MSLRAERAARGTIIYEAGLGVWGEAVVSETERASWRALVALRLRERYPRCRICVDIDSHHGAALLRSTADEADAPHLAATLDWLHTVVWRQWCGGTRAEHVTRRHATQPEAAREAKMVLLRMRPEIRLRLDTLARRWGLSRSAAVSRLVGTADTEEVTR